ncbi:MAG: restriction endonuclease [Alphaproteobacteria bacterium]|nr:MAG: restriction endonuclease [Alphaproteobacteria bacterium]
MVDSKLVKEINDYRVDISRANNESAKISLLTSLLTRLFDSPDAKEIIKQFSFGTEKKILNISRRGKASQRGRADTLYQRIIIEFEKDLNATENHAKEQLADYLSGVWNSGDTYNYTLISSDCTTWIVYAPDITTAEKLNAKKHISANDIILEQKYRLTLTQNNAEDFYYFLDTYLFKSDKRKATLDNIQRDFGQTSDTFIEVYRHCYDYFQSVKHSGEVKVAFEQWQRFLSIAYGSFDASERIFVIHSYLSVFAKMLAYEIITRDDYIDDNELKGIITGSIFQVHNVENFTDNDFFHWVGSDEAFKNLKIAFRAISTKIGAYDFTNVAEDILKGVYQELIDRDTRHSLGEYYTPDWLCEHIVDNLEIKKHAKLMDPACGSGSFLRAAIRRLRRDHPGLTANQLASQVCGIDIHPLSVLIAKTTVLLALGDTIQEAKQPITLNVYLADTLLTPVGSVNLDLFGDEFTLWIDDEEYSIDTRVFNDTGVFDRAVNIAEDLADYSKGNKLLDQASFTRALNTKVGSIAPDLINSFYNIYSGLKKAKEEDRDSIWKFIIQNLYKPCFYFHSFDFVIGNPPWFTFNSIGNAQYQSRLKQLASSHKLVSSVENMPNLEIAAIFLAHCTNYFLNENGKLAFVLPLSFFSADHHDNTRSGKTNNVRIIDLWDLGDVSPLFNVPACVLFTERPKANLNRAIPKSGRKGREYSGRLKAHNLNWEHVKDRISFKNKTYYYSKLGKSSAFTTFQMKEESRTNHYKKHFKKGADVIPRLFYFIDVTQEYKGKIKDRTLTVRSSSSFKNDAKEPWKSLSPLEGRINTNFLFRTALARNLLPFYLHNPELCLLPVALSDNKTINLVPSKKLIETGEIDTAHWFQEVEKLWDANKTEKNRKVTAAQWLNFQNKLVQQNLRSRFIVLYNSSAKDANSIVLDRHELDLEFIIEHTTYGCYTTTEDEANYVCSFLNSNAPNELIKAFQSKGLFGARHVHKKILDVPLPKFDPRNEDHLELASLGHACRNKTKEFVLTQSLSNVLGTRELGQIRLAIKAHLKHELKAIDKLITRIVEG